MATSFNRFLIRWRRKDHEKFAMSDRPLDGFGPLHGIRVLEIGTLIAAPFASRLFAEFGADVIKVEPKGGDPLLKHGVRKSGIRCRCRGAQRGVQARERLVEDALRFVTTNYEGSSKPTSR